ESEKRRGGGEYRQEGSLRKVPRNGHVLSIDSSFSQERFDPRWPRPGNRTLSRPRERGADGGFRFPGTRADTRPRARGLHPPGRVRRREAAVRELANAIRAKNALLFVGAGVSMNIGTPSWAELTAHMAGRLGIEPADFVRLGDPQTLAEF